MKTKQKNGISLIVLVITIIVMIVLATAIILALTSNGIIEKANKAKKNTDYANAKGLVNTLMIDWNLMSETDKQKVSEDGTFATYAKNKMISLGYKMTDSDNKVTGTYEVTEDGEVYRYPVIPEGFTASSIEGEKLVSEGLVIYENVQGQDNKVTAEDTDGDGIIDAQVERNQFVWIPVEDINEFVRREGYKEGELQTYLSEGIVTEPYNPDMSTITDENEILTVQKEQKEYKDMVASVEKYGGFYLARYEMGDDEATEARTGATEARRIVSKRDKFVYNYVPWGASTVNVGTFEKNGKNIAGAVALSRGMYENNEHFVSILPYGVQWDAMLRFVEDENHSIIDSSSWGAHSNYRNQETGDEKVNIMNGVQKSGITEHWKAKNLYEVAGNTWEWTMECKGKTRVKRGGYWAMHGNIKPVSTRYPFLGTTYIHQSYGFRVALYLL